MEKMTKYDIIEVFDDGKAYEVDVWHPDEYNPL